MITEKTEYERLSALVRRCLEMSSNDGTEHRENIKIYREFTHQTEFQDKTVDKRGRETMKRHHNKIFPKYNATVGIISSTEPAVEYMPKEGQPPALGEALSRRAADIWGEGGFIYRLHSLAQVAVRDGLSWLECAYHPDPARPTAPGGIALFVHDVNSVAHDPEARTAEDLRYVIVLEDTTQAQLDIFYPGWRDLEHDDNYGVDWEWMKQVGEVENNIIIVGEKADTHETIVRAYLRQLPSLDKLVTVELKKLIKTRKLPVRVIQDMVDNYDSAEDAGKAYAKRGVMVRLVRGGVLSLEPLLYDYPTFPIIPHNYLRHPEHLWGISMIHPLIDPQDGRDEAMHDMLEIMLHDGIPETLVSPEMFASLEQEEKAAIGRIREIKPGEVYEHKRGIGFDPAFLQLLAKIDEDIESISGHRDLSAMLKGQTAARALALASEVSQTPLIPVKFQLEQTIMQLGEHMLRIMRANTVAPVSVRMQVTEGNREWIEGRVGEELPEGVTTAEPEITGEDLQGQFEVRPVLKQGSAMEREAERARVREDSLLLSRLPPFMFAAVAEALSFPHWREMVEGMQRQQMEQEAQQQQMMEMQAMQQGGQGGQGGQQRGAPQLMPPGAEGGGAEQGAGQDAELQEAMQMLAERGEL